MILCTKTLISRRMKEYMQKGKISYLLCLSIILIVSLALTMTCSSLANAQQQNNETGAQSMATNTTNMNIVLVHGTWVEDLHGAM
jgi:hypothetical protein